MDSVRGGIARIALFALLSFSCGACSVVDQFAPRAATFNDATATSKSEAVLTNIVRATYSEPLQFTDISTAQGTSTIEGSLSTSIPFPFRGGFGVPLSQQFITPQPSVRTNGANQFNMTNLNTQEFYNGIQTPLTTQQIGSYLLSGTDPYILLLLSVAEIEVKRDKTRTVFRNEARSPADFRVFYTAVNELLQAGFSAEQTDSSTPVGPALSAAEAKTVLPDFIKTTAAEPLALRRESEGKFQVTKKGGATRFCFDPIKSGKAAQVNGLDVFVVRESTGLRPLALGYRGPELPPLATIPLSMSDACGSSKGVARVSGALDRSIRLRLRSVEGIFQYLGVLSRHQLGLVTGEPEDFSVGGYGYNVFRLKRGSGAVQAEHRGEAFGVDIDPSGRLDGSSRSLQFLTSLLAQQSSAKNFPSQNLVTVVGQ